MPWWSWVVIWTVLILGLVGMLVLAAVRLFRKLLTAVEALEDLGRQLTRLDPGDPAVSPAPVLPAIFAVRTELAASAAASRAERTYRRQVRRDARIRQGKLLGTSPEKRMAPHA